MRPNEYHLILENFPTAPGKIPLRLAGKLSERLMGLVVGVVRLNFEGRSDRPGKQPEWVKTATEVVWTALESDGKTGLALQAPQLGEALADKEYQGFFQEESQATSDVEHESALGLTIEAIKQATGQSVAPANGGLVDKGVLHQIQRLSEVFPAGISGASIILHNEKPTSSVLINRQVLKNLTSQVLVAPAPERIQVAGQLEAMQFSAADARVIVGNRKIKVHIPVGMLHGLGQFFGNDVLVQGIANYNVAGQVTSIEASNLIAASGKQLALFGNVPGSFATLPSVGQLKSEQSYKTNEATKRRELARQMNIQEPFEDLLKQLRDID